MRVMVLVKATADSEAGVLPDAARRAAMGHFNTQLAEAGVLLAGDGLRPTADGARVRFAGAERTVSAGPFAPADAQVAGFWLWQVRSLDEAVAWVRRCPDPMPGDSEIEIRPLYEAADFA